MVKSILGKSWCFREENPYGLIEINKNGESNITVNFDMFKEPDC